MIIGATRVIGPDVVRRLCALGWDIAVLHRGIHRLVLRLPKLYGPGENSDLVTVYGFRRQPQWRWTMAMLKTWPKR